MEERQNERAGHIKHRAVDGVEEGENQIADRKDDKGTENQPKADDPGNQASDKIPQGRGPIRLPVVRQLRQPIREDVTETSGVVDRVGDGIEHPIDVAKGGPIVRKHETQDQVLDAGDRQHAHISSRGKCLISAIKETEKKNGPGNVQYRSDNLQVDPVQSCLEKLLKIEHASLPLQKVVNLLLDVRRIGRA